MQVLEERPFVEASWDVDACIQCGHDSAAPHSSGDCPNLLSMGYSSKLCRRIEHVELAICEAMCPDDCDEPEMLLDRARCFIKCLMKVRYM